MRYRLLVGLVLLVMLLVAPAAATNLNFQNADDYNSITSHYLGTDGTVTWYENVSGGNNYIIATTGTNAAYIILNRPYQMTYSAATSVSSYAAAPILLKSDMTVLWNPTGYALEKDERYEVKISGGTAKLYTDNVLVATSPALATNPYYIGWGDYSLNAAKHSDYDDIVWGSSENMYVFGVPETEKFIIRDDMINSASDGLYNTTSNTQTDANYMPATWARGNTSLEAEYNNESVNLINYIDNTIWHTSYTGDTNLAGAVKIDIKTSIIDAGAPDGIYVLTIPGSGQYSNPIIKQSTGGTIYFDRDVYNRGETANVTYAMTPDYWDQSTYTYHLLIIDGLTGERVYDATVPSGTSYRTGFFDYTFADDDNIGVYYAVIEGVVTATPSVSHWFAADYAELSSYMSFYGYVNDGETATPIPGANIIISQYANSVTYEYTSPDGSYNTLGYNLQSGLNTVFNITASGYDQYYVSLITASARQKYLNFTLEKTPAYGGIAIGGVAREGILGVDNAVTYGYGAPIEGATVYVYNTTMNETYTVETNTAGWYLCDNNALCYLVNARPYIVQGNKTGYDPSPTYPVTVTGVF